MDLRHHSHGYAQCAYHVEIVPRYRHKIVPSSKSVARCYSGVYGRNGFAAQRMRIASDHAHVLGIGLTCLVTDAMKIYKCNSANAI